MDHLKKSGFVLSAFVRQRAEAAFRLTVTNRLRVLQVVAHNAKTQTCLLVQFMENGFSECV